MTDRRLTIKAEWIRWKDAQVSGHGWRGYEAAADETLCTMDTVGFIVSEDRERIVVAQTLDTTNENYANTTVIPKCWIVERFTIR